MVKRPPHLYGHSYLKDLPKDELNRFIVLCRFRNKRLTSPIYSYMTIRDIASLVRRSESYCSQVCKAHIKASIERR